MTPTTTDWIQALAAVLTMIAAFAALIVALKAPAMAAKFADQYRRESAAADELERFRMIVFQALMKCRSEILAADARAAINLVDVAFVDVVQVREARRLFMEATNEQPPNMQKIVERYHALIESVTRAMGLGDKVTGSDVRTGYYPEGVGKLERAALIEAEAKIARQAASDQSEQP